MAQLLLERRSKLKKCVVTLKNKPFSGYIAIAIGIKYFDWNIKNSCKSSQWRHLTERDGPQRSHGFELLKRLGLADKWETPLDLETLGSIDQKLVDYQLIVFHRSHDLYFCGTNRDKVVFLEFCGDSFNFIKNIDSYFGQKYCKFCNKRFDRRTKHRCGNGTIPVIEQSVSTQHIAFDYSFPNVSTSGISSSTSDPNALTSDVNDSTSGLNASTSCINPSTSGINSSTSGINPSTSGLNSLTSDPNISNLHSRHDSLVEYSDSEEESDQIGGSIEASKWSLLEKNLIQKNGSNVLKAKFKVVHNFDLNRIEEFRDEISNAFEEAIRPLLSQFPNVGYFSLSLNCDGLHPALFIPPMTLSNFDKNAFLFNILKVEQSNKEFLSSGYFDATINIYLKKKKN